MKEATARIKINKLLEAAGWRFFQEGNAPANIRLESSASIKSSDLDALGNDFEKANKGFIDFLLLDAKGFPLWSCPPTVDTRSLGTMPMRRCSHAPHQAGLPA
jgi:hypothetical protein